jgi:RNA polymerase sigma-54 factor
MLHQSLQQRLIQKLSPQQIQLIKLLEIPAMQLEQRIKEELEENPALEEGAEPDPDASPEEQETAKAEGEDFSIDAYLNSDIPSYKLNVKNYSQDDQKTEMPFSAGSSFHETLLSQLGLRPLEKRIDQLARYLIGNIDDDGYLRRSLEAVADDLAFSMGITTSEQELERILSVIQEFDPPGVGARNLKECLLLQLRGRDDVTSVTDARRILELYFDEFSKKHYDKILARMNITEARLKEAMDEILRLNPKPGGSFSDQHLKSSEHIIADFILENKDGELQLSLNSRNIPELKVSRMYSEMLESYQSNRRNASRQDREAVSFVKQKLDSAKWFIDAIRQRQQTLTLTMSAIIDYQRKYFLSGGDESFLVPMILKDIADKTGLDISTISRVANSKYIQTYFGLFPLKFFFPKAYRPTRERRSPPVRSKRFCRSVSMPSPRGGP